MTLNPLVLKQKLPHGQNHNRGSRTRYEGDIHLKAKKTDAKKRQVKWQHNARKTGDGDKK